MEGERASLQKYIQSPGMELDFFSFFYVHITIYLHI